MKTFFERDKATVLIGEKLVTVITVPGMQTIKRNGKETYITHFEARDREMHLVECTAFDRRALSARDMDIGDEAIVNIKATITMVEDSLEYKYTGCFICINPRQKYM